MINVVIFGAPGSGKGTQSAFMIEHYGLYHISTGDVLRDHISRKTELGEIARSYIDKGNLIPDDLMIDILASVIDEHRSDASKGFIFDGFPRTIAQAEAMDKLLADRGMRLNCVVGLDVPDEILIERLVNRGKESGRSDDNPETIRDRIALYYKVTSPLKDYYCRRGLFHSVKGWGDIDLITAGVWKIIDDSK